MDSTDAITEYSVSIYHKIVLLEIMLINVTFISIIIFTTKLAFLTNVWTNTPYKECHLSDPSQQASNNFQNSKIQSIKQISTGTLLSWQIAQNTDFC